MELRAPFRLMLRRAAGTAALGALLVPALAAATPADAAAAKRRAKTPVVTSVKPLKAEVGDTLTIRGRHFVRGRGRNTVIFKRSGGRAVFVKADIGTTKLLKVTLPEKLEVALRRRSGVPVRTRLQLRVLSRRLGTRFTSSRLSPVLGPDTPPPPPVPPKPAAEGDCDLDKVLNGVDADDDNDLLDDLTEARLRLDSCKLDSDGDGVEDGYEYRSARDLNDDEHQEPNGFLPYPEKRPYPNPLFADSGVDYDGDTLTLGEEHALWQLTGRPGLDRLSYSDGEQYTLSVHGANGRRSPTQPAAGYAKHAEFLAWAGSAGYAVVQLQGLNASPWDSTAPDWFDTRGSYDIRDFDRDGSVSASALGSYENSELRYYDHDDNGWLSDDERDEDADGLTNLQETRTCTSRSYWDKLYNLETPYYRTYAGTRLDDADSDGDGVRDGADDQDADDVPNVMECSRNAASGRAIESRATPPTPPTSTPAKGFVNPFNACLPAVKSRGCNSQPPLEKPWAPFNPEDKYYYVWN